MSSGKNLMSCPEICSGSSLTAYPLDKREKTAERRDKSAKKICQSLRSLNLRLAFVQEIKEKTFNHVSICTRCVDWSCYAVSVYGKIKLKGLS